MDVLLVVTHPRSTSLTHAAAGALAEGLHEAGHRSTLADLHREGFDPVLSVPDEPDWNGEKTYSPEVEREMERIRAHDAIAMVFPLWWWSLPAMLKGWIDRVWNRGFAYGPRNLAGTKSLMVALTADSEAGLAKRGYREAIRVSLQVGILDYCGMKDGRLAFLTGSLDGPERQRALVEEARRLGRDWLAGPSPEPSQGRQG
jgi:NAD(P)H dehydrogenase (quinone)